MEDVFRHNSYDKLYRTPFGAVPCGDTVTLRLWVPKEFTGTCSLRFWMENREQLFPMELSPVEGTAHGKLLEATVTVPSAPGLIWYYFCIKKEAGFLYCGPADCEHGGVSGLTKWQPQSYQITVYEPTVTPEWWKEGRVYQIFPDRFYNGNENGKINPAHSGSLIHTDWYDTPSYHRDVDGRIGHWDFFGGNLRGITKKLDYLKELGITILYLNPIFKARSNHRYDTGDYKKIDPMLGTEEDFDELVQEAGKRGIYLILDGVFSHTGCDSLYFNGSGNYGSGGAAKDKKSPYFSWYTFTDYPEKYQCWWDIDDLPNVNEMDSGYREYICEGRDSVVRYWMRRGIKGFRLDVADELPDAFIELLRKAVKEEDPEGILMGEVWEDASNKMAYDMRRQYFYGQELDGVMNYPFRDALLDFACGRKSGEDAQAVIMGIMEHYPPENLLGCMTLLGSHDRPRVLTLLGLREDDSLGGLPKDMTNIQKERYHLNVENHELGRKRLQMLWAFQMALPGAPAIYYGDEAGMEGFSDPYNRGTYPWGREDLSLRDCYGDILHMRKSYLTNLVSGAYCPLELPGECMGFRLEKENIFAYVCMNRSESRGESFLFSLPGLWVKCMELVTGSLVDSREQPGGIFKYFVKLPPLSTRIFYFTQEENHMNMPHGKGILLHPTSLPSPWRSGDLGTNAYAFADYLEKKKLSYWQILPLEMPDQGDSPYQSLGCKSGNPLLISMEKLVEQGLLTPEEIDISLQKLQDSTCHVPMELACFQEALEVKSELLHKAHQRFQKLGSTKLHIEYEKFLNSSSSWLPDFALYMTLRDKKERIPLQSARGKYPAEADYYRFQQFIFRMQWQELKEYCNQKNIFIIGDLPMYVSENSYDVWANPELFYLDEEGKADITAGVPGDYFNPKGQNWNCPVFRWDRLEESHFSWWKERISHALSLYDYVRLDHFRGFEAHWAAKYKDGEMVSGGWRATPGEEFFRELMKEFGSLPFIAEDLGHITPPVKNLRNQFDFPGMEIYMFSDLLRYGEELSELSHSVVYTGTHDNDTLAGWYVKECLNGGLPEPGGEECASYCRKVIEKLEDSPSPWIILPLQDVFALDSSARMNTPGTVGGKNWRWMISPKLWENRICERLHY